MIPSRKLLLEFRGRIHGGIDWAADAFLSCREPRQYLVKRRLPDDHKVDIALCCFLFTCNRSIHKRRNDLL